MQRSTPGTWRYRRAAGLCVIGSARLKTRPGGPGAGRGRHYFTWCGVAGGKWPRCGRSCPDCGVGHRVALDGPVARAAYQRGLDPAAFGFWRASAGAMVLGGCVAARLRPGAVATIRGMWRCVAGRRRHRRPGSTRPPGAATLQWSRLQSPAPAAVTASRSEVIACGTATGQCCPPADQALGQRPARPPLRRRVPQLAEMTQRRNLITGISQETGPIGAQRLQHRIPPPASRRTSASVRAVTFTS